MSERSELDGQLLRFSNRQEEKRQRRRGITTPNRVATLANLIREQDPNLEGAFTIEKAEALIAELESRKG